MSIKWTERRFSKSLQLQEQKDFLARKSSILPSEPLEDMVSCPIHLGIFEDPIQLPCGHSFCLECVDRCLKTHMISNNRFACPVCRAEWPVPIDGVRGWPSSYALNDIISYVNEQKRKMQNIRSNNVPSNDTSAFSSSEGLANGDRNVFSRASCRRRNSVMEKAEIVKKLAEDFSGEKVDKTKLISELSTILKRLQDSPEHKNLTVIEDDENTGGADTNSSRRSSFNQRCETEIARQEMSRLCEYRAINQKLPTSISNQLKSVIESNSLNPNNPLNYCIDFDEDDDYKKVVFVNDNTKNIVVYELSNQTTNSFPATLRSESSADLVIQPYCLKLFQDFIYLSGTIENRTKERYEGVLVKFSLDGKQIQCSERFASTNSMDAIGGFDIDATGRIFVALPSECSIALISPDLHNIDDKFVFGNSELVPNQLCYCPGSKEIWATCPTQKSILILDEDSGGYLQFGTSQLFNSCPGQIVCTQDNRVCFLDTRLSRIFWIKRHMGYLCIQKLMFSADTNSSYFKKNPCMVLRAFLHSRSLMLVASTGDLFLAKPTKGNEIDSQIQKGCCTIS